MLNREQYHALEMYSGAPDHVERVDTEPSSPGRHAVRVYMNTGWVVTLGQFGGVLREVPPMAGGSGPILVPLSDERRAALRRASNRLGARLEFALSGHPAWTRLDRDGNVTPLSRPYVRFAPPWAEDPRTLTDLLGRVDRCLNLSAEYQEVK